MPDRSRIINGVRAGWRDAAWSRWFALYLAPCSLAAALIAYAVEGRRAYQNPPSGLDVALMVAAGAVALWATVRRVGWWR